MFEAAELGQKLAKDDYKAMLPELREQLLMIQQTLRSCKFPVIVLFSGVDGAGKSEIVNLLNEWMDPRWLVTRAYDKPSDEESERPEYWRYWRDLPPKGQIGLFLSAWYSRPLLEHVKGDADMARFDQELNQIAAFEKTLTDDGALVIKFWMHLDKARQKKRLKKLEANPDTAWRVRKLDWKNWKRYDRFVEASAHLIERTDAPAAGWNIVEGSNLRYASVTVAQKLREAIDAHMEAQQQAPTADATESADDGVTQAGKAASVLSALDTNLALDKSDYKAQLVHYQRRLNELQRLAFTRKISTVMVFEGWDAAGKGGAVRRITSALDARQFRVIPIAAPTDEEHAQHYLWRFWRHLPRAGRVTIFDRSWYGRVLVERVEGFASAAEWGRAYAEINEFERELTNDNVVMCKFWLHITPDEQMIRFKDREQTPHKAWKLTDEDWRNRDRWGDYEECVDDIVAKTSTTHAPWTLVPANQKYYARVMVIKTVCERLEEALRQGVIGE